MTASQPSPPYVPGRRAGLLVPLFSLRSTTGWGIGEIRDLPHLMGWMRQAGLRLLQLLPVNELAPGEASPYSAMSAMAIDPQFIGVRALPDFLDSGGEASLSPELRAELAAVRRAPRIQYWAVRHLKDVALRQAFAHFSQAHWQRGTARDAGFRQFVSREQWWLEDYALFRALHASFDGQPWTAWPAPLRDRDPAALAGAARELEAEIRYRQYLQWIAAEEWREARARAGDIALFGDLPFMVSLDSADVWTRQDEFRTDARVGVPPDAFSDTGQDWGMPVYRWDVALGTDLTWLRQRGARAAALYDGFRVDHVVGFYRTYYRVGHEQEGQFTPTGQEAQHALGEQVLRALASAGGALTAEDLGVVPDFVRASLSNLGIPGYKVFRWEREWNQAGQPFIDPVRYPARSVAASGTHDTEPLVIWWAAASPDERAAVLAIPSVSSRLTPDEREALRESDALPSQGVDALLAALYQSGSDLLIQPVQDLFGWPDRINRPATVGEENWRWTLPWPVDRMADTPEAKTRAAQLRALAAAAERLAVPE